MNDENKIPEWAPALKDLKLRSRVRWNESLKRFNTWRIGGPSRGLVDVETEEDLAILLPFLKKYDILNYSKLIYFVSDLLNANNTFKLKNKFLRKIYV